MKHIEPNTESKDETSKLRYLTATPSASWMTSFLGLIRRKLDFDEFRARGRAICILKAMNLKPGDSLLDVGSCEGYFPIVASRIGVRTAVGVELNRVFVARAYRNAREMGVDCDFILGDAEFLPLRGGAIEKVLCAETLEHVPNELPVIKELVRVTNSMICVSVPNELQTPYSKIHEFHHPGHVRHFTEASLRSSFVALGARPTQFRNTGVVAMPRRIFSRLPMRLLKVLYRVDFVLGQIPLLRLFGTTFLMTSSKVAAPVPPLRAE